MLTRLLSLAKMFLRRTSLSWESIGGQDHEKLKFDPDCKSNNYRRIHTLSLRLAKRALFF